VPTLAFAPLFALMIWAGTWQLDRARQHRAESAAYAAATVAATSLPDVGTGARYLTVRLEGHYLADRQVLLDNMTHAAQPGYRVLTPFVDAAGTLLLVDRGWVALGGRRDVLPAVGVGTAPRTVVGRLDELPRAGLETATPEVHDWPRVLNYPTWATLEQALGRPLYRRVLLLDATDADGYLRDWQPPPDAAARNLGYAVQWFALAVTLAVLFTIVSFRKDPAR
jgi:surfeit locus 1 family protein